MTLISFFAPLGSLCELLLISKVPSLYETEFALTGLKLAVTIAFPFDIGSKVPFESTVTTFVFEEFHTSSIFSGIIPSVYVILSLITSACKAATSS